MREYGHLCPLAFWEYNIPQRLAVARHLAAGVRLKFQSGEPTSDRLSSTLDYCGGGRYTSARAHGLTGRALRRGRVR